MIVDRYAHSSAPNDPLSFCGGGYGCPFAVEHGHDGGVHPFAVVPQRLAQHALGAEADLFVDAAGTRVERVDLQADPVQAEPFEAVADDQPGRLGTEAAIAAAVADEDAEVAAPVAR